jgi:hypothetical protein
MRIYTETGTASARVLIPIHSLTPRASCRKAVILLIKMTDDDAILHFTPATYERMHLKYVRKYRYLMSLELRRLKLNLMDQFWIVRRQMKQIKSSPKIESTHQ